MLFEGEKMEEQKREGTRKIRYRVKRRAMNVKRKKGGAVGAALFAVLLLAITIAVLSYIDPGFPGWLDGQVTAAAAAMGVKTEVSLFSQGYERAAGLFGEAKGFIRSAAEKITGEEESAAESSGGLVTGEYSENSKVPENAMLSPAVFSCAAVLPVSDGYVTEGYALREHPITGNEDFHTGIDIAAREGEAVAAAWPGTVLETGENDIYGEYIVLEHGANLKTLYGHCEKICVAAGTVVRQGETIERDGYTGFSTGPHVHFEVMVDGRYVNPVFALGLC